MSLLLHQHSRFSKLVLICLLAGMLLKTQAQIPPAIHEPSSATAADIQSLNQKIDALRSEIAEIKTMLRIQATALPVGATRSAAPPVKIDPKMTLPFVPEQSAGFVTAPYVLVEFGDLQCPFCNDFAKHTLPGFIESYVKTGKIRFLSAEFPLDIHPDALKLSLASLCAGEQDRYFPMREILMDAKSPSSEDAIQEAILKLSLNREKMARCMASTATQTHLSQQIAAARKAGVYSTPAFLLGKVQNGAIKGLTFVGDLPPTEFIAEIDSMTKKLSEEDHDLEKQPSAAK